jgi:hypothetical protein
MAQRPNHLSLEQHANITKIDNLVGKSNPRLSNMEIIRSVQNKLPPLQTEEAHFQQNKHIQRSLLRWKDASRHGP